VNNLKWGFISGLSAFVICIALGVIFDVYIWTVFLRAVIFLVVFFSLGFGLRYMLNNYFPELLYFKDETEQQDDLQPQFLPQMPPEQPGSRINITLGKSGEFAMPDYRSSENKQELGNIEDLVAGNFKPQVDLKGIDRNDEDDYNKESSGGRIEESESFDFQDTAIFKPSAPPKQVFSPSFGDDSSDLGGLPDLDIMASAFSTGFSDEPETIQTQFEDAEEPAPVRTINKGNKPQMLSGDFNPEELAKGLRTILKNEK